MNNLILIIGDSGSGKTFLSHELKDRALNIVHSDTMTSFAIDKRNPAIIDYKLLRMSATTTDTAFAVAGRCCFCWVLLFFNF